MNRKTAKSKFCVRRNLFCLCLLPACLLAGCENKYRAKIIGTWEIEQADKLTSRLNARETNGQLSTAEQDPALMSVEFARSGQLTTTTRMGEINRTKNGTWTLVSFDETTQTAKVDCQIELQQSEHEIKLIDADTIEMTPPNMAGLQIKLQFRRAE